MSRSRPDTMSSAPQSGTTSVRPAAKRGEGESDRIEDYHEGDDRERSGDADPLGLALELDRRQLELQEGERACPLLDLPDALGDGDHQTALSETTNVGPWVSTGWVSESTSSSLSSPGMPSSSRRSRQRRAISGAAP